MFVVKMEFYMVVFLINNQNLHCVDGSHVKLSLHKKIMVCASHRLCNIYVMHIIHLTTEFCIGDVKCYEVMYFVKKCSMIC